MKKGMFWKLLRDDLKFIYQYLVWYYVIALILGVVSFLVIRIDQTSIMRGIQVVVQNFALTATSGVIVSNLNRVWLCFQEGIYSKPTINREHIKLAKKHEIYNAKFWAALITVMTSTIVLAVTCLINYDLILNFSAIENLINNAASTIGSSPFSLVIFLAFAVFLQMAMMLCIGFTAIIFGHFSKTRRWPLEIAAGIGTFIITQTLVILVIFLLALWQPDLMALFKVGSPLDVHAITKAVWISIIVYAAVVIALNRLDIYLLTRPSQKK